MNCERTRAELSAHLDQQLASSTRVEVDHHLAACPDCRAELDGFRAALLALRSVPVPSASPEHVQRVMAAVAAAAGAERGPRWGGFAPRRGWLSHLAAAAAGALLAVGSYLWWAQLDGERDFAGAAADGQDRSPLAVALGAPSETARIEGLGADRGPGLPDRGPGLSDRGPGPSDRGPGPSDAASQPLASTELELAARAAQSSVAAASDVGVAPPLLVPPRLVPIPVPLLVPIGPPPSISSTPRPDAAAALAHAVEQMTASLERWGQRFDRLEARSDVLAADRLDALPTPSPPLAGSPATSPTEKPVRRGVVADEETLSRAPAPPRPDVAVRVQQVDGRVRIETRGTVDEIVPALLARLDDPERAVRDAVERRLVLVARDLGLEGPRSWDGEGEGEWWRSTSARAAATSSAGSAGDRRSEWERWWASALAVR